MCCRRYPLNAEAPYGTAQVVRSGEPEVVSVVADEILDAEVVLTIVNGEVVYDRDDAARRTATDAEPEAGA